MYQILKLPKSAQLLYYFLIVPYIWYIEIIYGTQLYNNTNANTSFVPNNQKYLRK